MMSIIASEIKNMQFDGRLFLFLKKLKNHG
jgi:hypothetical protein